MDNAFITEVHYVMYVVINEAEKHVSYGKLVGTHRMYDVISEMSH